LAERQRQPADGRGEHDIPMDTHELVPEVHR
jgi:hypothetical protein